MLEGLKELKSYLVETFDFVLSVRSFKRVKKQRKYTHIKIKQFMYSIYRKKINFYLDNLIVP